MWLAEEQALVFSDIMMPDGMNGYELAEQDTRKRPGVKVLLTSGNSEKLVTHISQTNVNAHLLAKPYSQAKLTQRIQVIPGE